jgi:hypothetical protein
MNSFFGGNGRSVEKRVQPTSNRFDSSPETGLKKINIQWVSAIWPILKIRTVQRNFSSLSSIDALYRNGLRSFNQDRMATFPALDVTTGQVKPWTPTGPSIQPFFTKHPITGQRRLRSGATEHRTNPFAPSPHFYLHPISTFTPFPSSARRKPGSSQPIRRLTPFLPSTQRKPGSSQPIRHLTPFLPSTQRKPGSSTPMSWGIPAFAGMTVGGGRNDGRGRAE